MRTEKQKLGLTDIAKEIKQQLRKEYPKCKFSITTQFYSGGQSLHIYILQTDFKMVKPFEELSENAIFKYCNIPYKDYRKVEELKENQNRKHHQITDKIGAYNPDEWNNGVFLTEQGHNLAKRISELCEMYNWDNSDSQIDYFDVNFYLHLNIGRYDKPLIEVCE